ncbi:MAG: YgiQ family radical SAM protein, partial [Acutalibacteraceae bacterium]
MDRSRFLPVSKADMAARGIEQLDFVYISGDAYVDHPSFGTAIIARVLEASGFSVGIIAQPDWRDPASISALGEPRLGFLVSAGNMDSMVNHYSVSKSAAARTPSRRAEKWGLRPDYAAVVYANLIRRTYKKTPVILGGIEASLRRLAHYDYWSDRMKRSVLLDSGADLISYGMGERSIVEIAEALRSGIPVRDITFVRGTVYKTAVQPDLPDAIRLPGFDKIATSKGCTRRAFTGNISTPTIHGEKLVEPYPADNLLVQNPPQKPLSTEEMDAVYALPYARAYHPDYEAAGGIPAIEEIKFSLASCRGCFGACNFCALTFHQGRIIQTRSHESLLEEARQITQAPDFKGYIHDVGGPTANFRQPACKKQLQHGACQKRQCLFPEPCPNLEIDHSDYVALLRKLRALPKVKRVFVRSGIRFDYLINDKDETF